MGLSHFKKSCWGCLCSCSKPHCLINFLLPPLLNHVISDCWWVCLVWHGGIIGHTTGLCSLNDWICIQALSARLLCACWPLQIGFNGLYFANLWSRKLAAFAGDNISCMYVMMDVWYLQWGFYPYSRVEICPLSSLLQMETKKEEEGR